MMCLVVRVVLACLSGVHICALYEVIGTVNNKSCSWRFVVGVNRIFSLLHECISCLSGVHTCAFPWGHRYSKQ